MDERTKHQRRCERDLSHPRKNQCDCSKRTHGNPKVGDGMCQKGGHSKHGHKYRAAVHERQHNRQVCRTWADEE